MKVHDFNLKKKFSEVSGVSSYVDSRVHISLNEKGEYEEYIHIDENTELGQNIENVSPCLNNKQNETVISEKLYSKIKDIKYDHRIGYYQNLYIGHVSEGEYRKNASSGGMGTWIFKELLENKIIDGVIHVKKNKDVESEILFTYEISRTIEEVQSGAKTKYYPVELSKVLEVVKNNPGRYAIVGIPSFIKAIRLLSMIDPIINERIILTVGLICGHQKSAKFAEYMAWQVGIKPGDLLDIDFRYKLDNAPADSYAIKMTGLINGKLETIVKPKNELHGQNWGLGYFKSLASDFTDDVFNETADLVIGDAWLPEYANDSYGNNIIIIRNSLVNEIIQKALSNKKLKLDVVSVEKIFDSQSAHYRHTHDELAYRMYKQKALGSWFPKCRVEASNNIPFFRAKVQDVRMDISKKSHEYYIDALNKNDINLYITKMSILERKYQILYFLMRIRNKGIRGLVDILFKKISR